MEENFLKINYYIRSLIAVKFKKFFYDCPWFHNIIDKDFLSGTLLNVENKDYIEMRIDLENLHKKLFGKFGFSLDVSGSFCY